MAFEQVLRRRTKIVATIGPACDEPEVLDALILAGTDMARLNFSHGKPEEHIERASRVRASAKRMGRHVSILGDLSGPKIRIEQFKDGPVHLHEGELFTLDVALAAGAGTKDSVGCAYKDLIHDVHEGDTLLLNDGLIVLEVTGVIGSKVLTRISVGGQLSDNKGLNRRGGGLSAGAITEKDRRDIELAARIGVDYLGVSFPKTADDMLEAARLLRAAGGLGRTVAKIERTEAIHNLDDIILASDAVMVARGDLGVEVGYAELTGLQKRIISRARHHFRVVITATQMMESMILNPIPTRAEVSDVANAVLDGTDAVMLSAESAIGNYPIKAVETMAQVIVGAEKYQFERGKSPLQISDETFHATDEAIARVAMYAANHMDVRAIVALTESGSTPLWMSRIRSDIPIFAFTRHETTQRRVTLYRGVYPVAFDVTHIAADALYSSICAELLRLNICKAGELVIVTKGEFSGVAGGTNAMKILKVDL
jgi:pyruvate kinase